MIRKLLIILAILITLIFLLFRYTSFDPFVFIIPANDSIDKAAKETRILIMKSELTGNYEELGAWIADDHGEAPDQQIMIDIGHWATKNKNGFKTIIQLLETLGKLDKLDLLSFMLVQSGQEEKFIRKYKYDKSKLIQGIVRQIKTEKAQTDSIMNKIEGVKPASKSKVEYKLLHYDGCTGTCEFLIDRNDTIPFQFSKDSDSKAMETLRALRWQVFLPNTSTKNLNLIVIGHLTDKKISSESGKGKTKKYYEFNMENWYLKSPLAYADIDEISEVPIEYEIKAKSQLDSLDFIGIKISSIEIANLSK